jgi:hypothetical protein
MPDLLTQKGWDAQIRLRNWAMGSTIASHLMTLVQGVHTLLGHKKHHANAILHHVSPRQAIPGAVRVQVLTEAGYRCAVPTCRNILALDLHHIEEVVDGGGNEPGNLLALCPTCHALYTRGTITRDSIHAWKLILVSLTHAFDANAIDDLLFLRTPNIANLRVSGDGVLKFSRLIAAGLAQFNLMMQNGPLVIYQVSLTAKDSQLIDAWQAGNRNAVAVALGQVEN